MHNRKFFLFLLWAVFVLSAHAAEPATSGSFNVHQSNVDLKSLTRDNFYDMVVPAAKRGSTITLYNFAAGSFPDLFRTILVPGFEKKYGIKIQFQHVKSALAIQQFLAVKRAKKDPPADVFFMPSSKLDVLLADDVLANINLYAILPSAKEYPAVTQDSGILHGGAYARFHGNQTAIGYNYRSIKANKVPTTIEGIYEYAKKTNKRKKRPKVAITAPSKGGSGQGFLIAVVHAKVKGTSAEKGLMTDYTTVEDATKWIEQHSQAFEAVWDYYRRLMPYVEFTNGNADTLNLISNAVVHFGTVWEDMVFGQIATGDTSKNLRLTIPKEGMPGSYNGLIINADTKNVAASLLLVDYLLSDTAQLEKLGFMASRSPNPKLSLKSMAKDKKKYLISDKDMAHAFRWVNSNLTQALKLAFVEHVINK